MVWGILREHVVAAHQRRFQTAPTAIGFAPGRIEILGNHTDYNEGYVLAAAIELGLCFALSPSDDKRARVFAPDLKAEAVLDVRSPQLDYDAPWVNYPAGVLYKLHQRGSLDHGFNATITGDLPMGSGMSSSAALTVAAALALTSFYGVRLPPLELAKLCQQAEEEFVGLRCGLLDQVASLFGAQDRLVFVDFRKLEVKHIGLPLEATLLVCSTDLQRELVNSEYNLRRTQCEEAAAFFRKKLGRQVGALRDVTLSDLQTHSGELGGLLTRRAAHVIGENQRVIQGVKLLARNEMALFGALMYASHESSMQSFENSSPDQDFLVLQARRLDGVFGARLSGGGFGGNVVVLAEAEQAEAVGNALGKVYREAHGKALKYWAVRPSGAARLLPPG